MSVKDYMEFEDYKLDLINHLKFFNLHGLTEEASQDDINNFTYAMVETVKILREKADDEERLLFLYNLALVAIAKLFLKYGETEIMEPDYEGDMS